MALRRTASSSRRVRVEVNPRIDKLVAASRYVTNEREQLAQRVSDRARANTVVSDDEGGGAARDSHRVEVVGGVSPPIVAAAAGGGSGGSLEDFHYIFQELGGNGFRPPPAPLRRAAVSLGLKYRRRSSRS